MADPLQRLIDRWKATSAGYEKHSADMEAQYTKANKDIINAFVNGQPLPPLDTETVVDTPANPSVAPTQAPLVHPTMPIPTTVEAQPEPEPIPTPVVAA